MDRPETSMTGERIEGEEQNDLGGTLRPTEVARSTSSKPSRLATHVDQDTGEFSSGGGW